MVKSLMFGCSYLKVIWNFSMFAISTLSSVSLLEDLKNSIFLYYNTTISIKYINSYDKMFLLKQQDSRYIREYTWLGGISEFWKWLICDEIRENKTKSQASSLQSFHLHFPYYHTYSIDNILNWFIIIYSKKRL